MLEDCLKDDFFQSEQIKLINLFIETRYTKQLVGDINILRIWHLAKETEELLSLIIQATGWE